MKIFITNTGYEVLTKDDRNKKQIFIHRLMAENMLGGTFPVDQNGRVFDVHHIDRNKTNNDIDNLMVLSRSDHMILHQNLRAIDAGFPEQFRCCRICNKFDDPKNMSPAFSKNILVGYGHRECDRKRAAEYRKKNPQISRPYNPEYYKANRERINMLRKTESALKKRAAYSLEYYKANRERLKMKRKAEKA